MLSMNIGTITEIGKINCLLILFAIFVGFQTSEDPGMYSKGVYYVYFEILYFVRNRFE